MCVKSVINVRDLLELKIRRDRESDSERSMVDASDDRATWPYENEVKRVNGPKRQTERAETAGRA